MSYCQTLSLERIRLGLCVQGLTGELLVKSIPAQPVILLLLGFCHTMEIIIESYVK